MSLPNPVQEASEIVAALAAVNPAMWEPWTATEPHGGGGECFFCEAEEWTRAQTGIYHEPDCLWIRARRLTRLPVAPHKVRS